MEASNDKDSPVPNCTRCGAPATARVNIKRNGAEVSAPYCDRCAGLTWETLGAMTRKAEEGPVRSLLIGVALWIRNGTAEKDEPTLEESPIPSGHFVPCYRCGDRATISVSLRWGVSEALAPYCDSCADETWTTHVELTRKVGQP